MRTLYIVRHGETPWNRDKIFRGHADIELSETGLLQAARVGEALASVELERIYSSPLRRCQQTALATKCGKDVPIEVLDGIIDIDYGDWSGQPDEQVASNYPELYRQYQVTPESVTFPNGESLGQAQSRAMTALDVAISQDWDIAALVTHRVVLKLILMALLGMPLSKFWTIKLDPCSISKLEVTGDMRTVSLVNDINHLHGIEQAHTSDF